MEAYPKNPRRVNGVKTFFVTLGVFAFTVCLFVGMFAFWGMDRETLSLRKTYYFLVRDCEDTTASAVSGQVYLAGGAGYLLEEGEKNAVVLSCYFQKTDAERVQGMMKEKDLDVRLVEMKTSDFTLKGESAKLSNLIKGNAETIETCAKILYETANGLERSDVSQAAARAALRGVSSSLKGLREGNKDERFTLWNSRLKEAERRAIETYEGIIFSKDLRYLQVELLLLIVKSDLYFG